MASSLSNSEILGASAQAPTIKTSDNSYIFDQPSVTPQSQMLHQVGGKHQVLPVVYIQAPKLGPNKQNSSGSNVILNAMPQIQIQNLTPANVVTSKNVTLTTSNVGPQSLLIGKQPIMLQKPSNLMSGSKNGVYFTMLKPVSKPDDSLLTGNRIPISSLNKIHTFSTSNTSTNSTQKFVIAPMPKVTSNRLPITATTNTVQSKISFMPITIPNTNKHKVINFKITDGQIQQDNAQSTIKVMCETPKQKTNVNSKDLLCNEKLDIDSPVVPEDKAYQISIAEDSNSRQDTGYTISINEGEKAKEHPKFSKHGVSILKKSYGLSDKKEQPKVTQQNFTSITTVSDTNTKEVKITSEQKEEPQQQQQQQQKKSERRRKSTICLRKDYDDVRKEEEEIAAKKLPKIEEPSDTLDMELKQEDSDEYDNLDSKVKIDLNMDVDPNDVVDLLTWEDDIGSLPGSDLKFLINEFGFLEYLTKDEYRKIFYKKQSKVKAETEKKKSDVQEEMRCLECGCYGMPSEFISSKHCSLDCQNAFEKENPVKVKKKTKYRLPPISKRVDSEAKQEQSEEENVASNENSQDKYSYPWTCQKKGFSWSKYLDHVKAKSAPVKLFKDAFPYNKNGFRQGMKLEGIDPMHPSYFCVLTVTEVLGYRIRLHFDGYPENYDFWVNADSMDIFPAGFCEKYGHTLHPPPGYESDFNWNFYLKYTRSPAAPKHLFANRQSENAIFCNGFRTGMKLEAVDRKNTSLVCVATIKDTMDNRILVHFDSWDDIYDYWADPMSAFIHPVGWCDQNGHNLTPPNDYPNPDQFTWEKYLKETKSVAAPVRAFKQRPPSGFRKSMRLECVDRRVPQLIRVATVDDVRDHQLRISFDGWPDRYSYWVDVDSPDIHPVGWCQKTGHPIEPPLTPDDVYDFLECATVGCRGQGHIKGPVYATHSTQKNCPYAEENIDLDKILPDRLLTPDRQIEAVVPVSREPRDKIKLRNNKQAKFPRLEHTIKMEWSDEDEEDDDDFDLDTRRKPKKLFTQKEIKKELEEEDNAEEKRMFERHQRFLAKYVKCRTNPRDWTLQDVVNFVMSIPSSRQKSALFYKHKIDGMSLLMLTQQDLVEVLNFKLGPAIKFYNCVLILRNAAITCT